MNGGHVGFFKFLTFKALNNLKSIEKCSYMPHILIRVNKRNMYISNMIQIGSYLRQEMHSKAYSLVVRGGGHFWRVTP